MPVPYFPSKSSTSAGYQYSGVSSMRDPGVVAVTENTDVMDARYFGEPIMSNVLALWAANNVGQDYQRTYVCAAGLAVGNPVRIDTVTGDAVLATADTIPNSKIIGFVANKPTTTSCYLTQYFRDVDTFSSVGYNQDVYLSDTGTWSLTAGTVAVLIGRTVASDQAIGFTMWNQNTSGFSGYSGRSGYSGLSGCSGFSGPSGLSGYSGYSGPSGYSGASGFSGAWSGPSGPSGFSGPSGPSGYSGPAGGASGYSGKSGYSGISGKDANPQFAGAMIFHPSGTAASYAASDVVQVWSSYSSTGFDTDAMASGSSKLTIKKAGKYLVQATHTGYDGYSTVDYVTLLIRKNGNNYVAKAVHSQLSGVTAVEYRKPAIVASTVIDCIVGDYFEVVVKEAITGPSGTTWTPSDNAAFQFSAVLISGETGASGASGVSGFDAAAGYSGPSGYSGISGYSGVSAVVSQVQTNLSNFKTANQTMSTLTLAAISNLDIVLQANTTYRIRVSIPWVPYSTGGDYCDLRMAFSGTLTAGGFVLGSQVGYYTSNSPSVGQMNYQNTVIPFNQTVQVYATTSAATSNIISINGYITVGASGGTLQPYASWDRYSVGYPSTILAGAWIEAATGSGAISGYSGAGASGYSGTSGYSGFSGAWSGPSGPSGISGRSGQSGFSGTWSGPSGPSGYSGKSGYSGYSGVSGFSSQSGISGYSGASGPKGWSGISGPSGAQGGVGFSGPAGYSGLSGAQGISGFSGLSGVVGTSGFSGASGYSGYSGKSGIVGVTGASGLSGISGPSGKSGVSGYSGVSGPSGKSGISGPSGFSGGFGGSGTSGRSGYSGVSGFSGVVGPCGVSGYSGSSGFSGVFSGASGRSGYSGIGPSGYSGTSGARPDFISTIDFYIDGGGSPLSTDKLYGWVYLPYDCVINQWTLLADTTGDFELDIWRIANASHPATAANSIVGINPPVIVSSNRGQLVTTGWSNACTAGDVLYFYVRDCSCITRVLCSLKVTRS